MVSCPRVAPAAGMVKRTGKTDPRPPLLHLTQNTPVGLLGTYMAQSFQFKIYKSSQFQIHLQEFRLTDKLIIIFIPLYVKMV